MAAYIDADYVDAFLSLADREAIFDDGGGYDSTFFDQLVTSASQLVKIAAKHAGYDLGATSTDETVKMATFGQFIVLAFQKKSLQVPEQYINQINLLEAIRQGKVPLESDPDALRAVGGVYFTSSDETDTTGIADGSVKPQIFKTLRVSW